MKYATGITSSVSTIELTMPPIMGAAIRFITSAPVPVVYHRLCGLGEAKEVVLIACMRKRLTLLNTMLKHRTLWLTENSQHA